MSIFEEETPSAAELEEQIKAERNEVMAREAHLLEMQSKIAALDAELRSLRMERDVITQQKMNSARNIRELERQFTQAQRFEKVAAERRRLQEEFEIRSAELDELTKDMPWRKGINFREKTLTAFPHQIEGAKRLAVAKRGICADKRGLGKTLTGIAWLDCVEAKKILLIAPNDVVPQFEGELKMWAFHRRIMSFAGLNKEQRKIIYPMLKMLDEFVITLNYEAWRRDKTIIDDLISAGVDTVILDEAHRAKASNKQTAKGIIQVVHSKNYCAECDCIIQPEPWYQNSTFKHVNPAHPVSCPACGNYLQPSVQNVLSMTGTPMLNKPQEIFTMLHLIDPYRFSGEKQFLYDYCVNYAPNKWKFSPGGLERLIDSMKEYFVQRNREDAGIIIPPPAITTHYLEPDPVKYPKQWRAYEDLTQAAALIMEDGTAIDMLYALEIILRERQIMAWPAGVELKIRERVGDEVIVKEVIRFDVRESQKLDAVQSLAEDLAEEGERFIVFSKFKAPLYELQRRMGEIFKTTTATGDDSDWQRKRVLEDFDLKTASENEYRWVGMFATYDAFATGVNLNAARHVIFLDDEWNQGMEDQAIGRIDRLNSEDQANVHIFRVKDSVDMFMERLIEQKKNITEGFEGGMKQTLMNWLKGDKDA